MTRRPTVADIAARSGLSIATVDRVLNARLPVRRETAERVLGAAQELGYHGTGLIRRRLERFASLSRPKELPAFEPAARGFEKTIREYLAWIKGETKNS